MYRYVLVAIDDSETSRKALDEAIALAKAHGARLAITHAVDESLIQSFVTHGAALTNTKPLEEALTSSGRVLLDDAVDHARRAGIEATPQLLASQDMHAADQIAQAVETTGADVLVVGSHGRRGFRRLLLGSVAENLMRKVAVSLLIVRGQP